MASSVNHADTERELLKIALLRASHRMLNEEWNDRADQVRSPINDVLPEVLTMVVVAPILEEPPNAEETSQLLQTVEALRSLRHDEPVRHMVAGSVALSLRPVWLSNESDGETTFSVYKADDPASPDQPFLLIVRITRHVVTIVNGQSDVTMSSAGYPEFPAYGRLHRRNRFRRGLAIEP